MGDGREVGKVLMGLLMPFAEVGVEIVVSN